VTQAQPSGLTVPGVPAIGERLESEIHAAWNTFDDVEAELAQLAFPPIEKPAFSRPSLAPGMLTQATGDQVTEMHVKFNAWYSYAANLLARIKGGLSQVNNEMTVLAIELRKGHIAAAKAASEKKPSKDDLADLVVTDPRYKELMREKQKMDQHKSLMESQADALYRDWQTVNSHLKWRAKEVVSGHTSPQQASQSAQAGVAPYAGQRAPGRI
jgi:hypothetical protein